MNHSIKQELLAHDLEVVRETLMEISQTADWLASLNAQSDEIANGLSYILLNLRDKADFAYETATYHLADNE